MIIRKIISKSPSQTQKVAGNLAKKLKGGDILALEGDLGGGKTTFVQGLAIGLGIKQKITSPTFIMLREYRIPKSSSHQLIDSSIYRLSLIHIDLYRLKNIQQITSIGTFDYLGKKNYICVIEWAEKIKNLLPKNIHWIKFEFIDQNSRKIIFFKE